MCFRIHDAVQRLYMCHAIIQESNVKCSRNFIAMLPGLKGLGACHSGIIRSSKHIAYTNHWCEKVNNNRGITFQES